MVLIYSHIMNFEQRLEFPEDDDWKLSEDGTGLIRGLICKQRTRLVHLVIMVTLARFEIVYCMILYTYILNVNYKFVNYKFGQSVKFGPLTSYCKQDIELTIKGTVIDIRNDDRRTNRHHKTPY